MSLCLTYWSRRPQRSPKQHWLLSLLLATYLNSAVRSDCFVGGHREKQSQSQNNEDTYSMNVSFHRIKKYAVSC